MGAQDVGVVRVVHVGDVLGKLGAANRTEAVARARELSLIPRPGPVPPAAAEDSA